MGSKEPKNGKLLASFIQYCTDHPEERFWQALRNWAGVNYILVAKTMLTGPEWGWSDIQDTFYWGENKPVSEESV